MAVPFIDLKRFEPGLQDAWNQKVKELSANTQFMGGPEVNSLEETLLKDNQTKYALGCANGTDAIQLALRASEIGRGDTVLVPDSTFWATFEAVVNVSADPVTVDINRNDLQMDYDLFCEAVTKFKPKAAILVHLYGWGSAKLSDFRKFAKENNVLLIEDGAQSYGVTYKGESIYKNALSSTISFYPAKVLGAAGDAGAVLTSNDAIAEKVRSLGNHGREAHYAHGSVGWNSRIDTMQAAYLNLALKHFSSRMKSRQDTAKKYRDILSSMNIMTVAPPEGYVENGYLNVTIHEASRREELKKILGDKGIGFGIVYPGPVSEQKGASDYIKAKVGGENAKWLSESVLNLPLFPYMTDSEFDEVISALK
ncbi:MAG: DegT/DnrJ/EryC1/StrS family aminotransferase [Spirochaetia bacterium]|nr:DegT/DnrJ/EryC1/StrS family aminotransferase [Spirochaetia bacterium]